MKKITFLMLHMGYGGVESAVANQANMLCDEFEIEIISLYKLSYKSPHKLNKKIKVNYLTNLEPNRERFKEALRKFNVFNILKEGIKAIKILYLKKHLMKEYIKKSDSDIIVSTRLDFNGLLGKYAKEKVIKVAQEHVYHKNDKKYIKKLVNSFSNIDYITPVSKELTDFYSKKVKDSTKCVYIKHALDFVHEKYKFKMTNDIIAVARLSKEKGFSDLLDVVKIVQKENKKIRLHLVGDGQEKHNLQNKIKELELENNVIMHGFKNREEVIALLKQCSVYCMTSFEESFGLSVIEAMAFGVPCITFDSAKGVLEILDDECGVTIKDRNKQQMALAIVKLLESEEKIKEMSKKAYEKSLEYSQDQIKKQWIYFYNNITQKKV